MSNFDERATLNILAVLDDTVLQEPDGNGVVTDYTYVCATATKQIPRTYIINALGSIEYEVWIFSGCSALSTARELRMNLWCKMSLRSERL